VGGHEDSSAAGGALTLEAVDLVVLIDLRAGKKERKGKGKYEKKESFCIHKTEKGRKAQA